MDKIKIAITGRVASVVALPEVVADNAEYEMDFALDPREGWDMALPITALFVRRDGSYTARILDAGATSCTMPPQTGTNIVFAGLTQDDMRTTTPATIKVRRSIRTVAHDPLPAPSEDVYAQILAAYAGIKILSGRGAPTLETQGKANQLYRDEDTQKLYICTAADDGYTWAAVSGGGGSVDVDATLTKAGYAADAKAAGDAIDKKLDATALPTAINDALAQAKASGAFDGAKGDKGDTGPEGPKGDTGSVGPKGADGKDGAGMDVTGAKVGQIAKITAVDGTGKPTGWEPVDMPSGEDGGGGLEFIQSFALSPNIGQYELANIGVYKRIRVNIRRTAATTSLGSGNMFVMIAHKTEGGNYLPSLSAAYATKGYGSVFQCMEVWANTEYAYATNIGAGNNRLTMALTYNYGIMNSGAHDDAEIFANIMGDINNAYYVLSYAKPSDCIDGNETVYVYGEKR